MNSLRTRARRARWLGQQFKLAESVYRPASKATRLGLGLYTILMTYTQTETQTSDTGAGQG